MNKKIKIVLLTLASVVFLFLTLLFIFRNNILHRVINRVIASQARANELKIDIREASFSGLTSVSLKGISVVPFEKDTLVTIEEFKVSVKLFPLLFAHIKVAELSSTNGTLYLSVKDSVSNFDFLLRKSRKDTTQRSSGKVNLAKLADNLINEVLYKVPDQLQISDYHLVVNDEEKHFSISAPEIRIKEHQLNSTFILDQNQAIWHGEGTINASRKNLDIRFFSEKGKVELPYLEEKFGLKLSFDTISTHMDHIDFEDHQLKIFGNWSLKNLLVNHPKIAAKDVIVPSASIDCNMFIGPNFISIDSSSVIYLGKLKASPFIKYTLSPSKIYELKLNSGNMSAQDFFDSFPTGLFESLEGIKVEGKLAYNLNFYLDPAKPWECKFNSGLARENFRVVSFGNTNLQKINGSFIYTPYEYGKPMRPILVGPENPDFTPYDRISDYLKNAILTTEDPSFFTHRGFYEEAFRQSIATNIIAGRFKRGASTISMQLVKNVYLNRNKTIARKLEEVLIVWLIETNHLVPKQRMFEVYLNIIEWAPNVYGVTEAARFYFNKRPSQLTLGESIFMASVIPKPKKFKYSFSPDGQMKPYLQNFFKLISGLMIRREKISESDTVNLFSSVTLRGPAKNYVLSDSLLNTLQEDRDEEMELLKELLGK